MKMLSYQLLEYRNYRGGNNMREAHLVAILEGSFMNGCKHALNPKP